MAANERQTRILIEGPDLQLDIRPTMGPGAAWGDVNDDGWHDLYLVQAWRPADWPEGVYSIVRYDFAETDGGTTLSVTHSAIPDGAAEHLAEGWRTMYWGPLATYLAN